MSTDLIIVGGGLMGASLAHFCAAEGIRTVLVDATAVGAGGATAHSRGIVRVYDPVPALMHWALRGVEEWSNWQVAGPSPFVSCGVTYLVAASRRPAVERAMAEHDQQRYPIELWYGADLAKRAAQFAHLCAAGDLALHEPRGGFVDTRLAARLFAQSAVSMGAAMIEGSAVRAVSECPQNATVEFADSQLKARMVVIAAGAASPLLMPGLEMFSRSIPLSCLHDDGSKSAPAHCLIDEKSGGYLRPGEHEFFFCGGAAQSDAALPSALAIDVRAAGLQHLALGRHLTTSDDLSLLDTRPGFDGYTPDFMPLLGVDAARPRLGLATGFSGRGAKYIPAVARQMAATVRLQLRRLAS